jgi:uncharacterized Ntn-hydrolase superfamily protein
MISLKGVLLSLIILVTTITSSSATWSIIVVDPKTGAIGIAGASCTNSVYGIGRIVPGKGAIIVQAMSNGNARAKGAEMILAGATPEQILQTLKDPKFNPQWQQYAVVCMNDLDGSVTYTGDSASVHKGALTARGISVQGNILASADVLTAVLDAALKAQQDGLPLEEVLLRALEAGADKGGDRRCGESKASSAFITIMKTDDKPGKPHLNIVVNKESDNSNAVETLRNRFDASKKHGAAAHGKIDHEGSML